MALGKEIAAQFKRDRVSLLAAAVAYNTIFALPAVILLTVMIGAVVDRTTSIDVTSHLRDLIRNHAPASTQELLNDQVDSAIANASGGGLSIGIIVTAAIALWSGSNAIGTLAESFNAAYGVEESRPLPRLKLMTFGLTLLLTFAINFAFVALIFGRRIGEWVADEIDAGGLFEIGWSVVSAILGIVVFAGFLALLYHFGPDLKQPFRWVTPGMVLATILWLILTAGFGLFLRVIDPGSAYGLVGSVLVLIFFLNLTALVFILGAELNSIAYAREIEKNLPADA
jgi:membrane protein